MKFKNKVKIKKMGNDNSSPEPSPSRTSRSNRKISPIKHQKSLSNQNIQKMSNIKYFSKISKTLSSSRIIMNFISKCENAILLKNMNDSNNIGLNHTNIFFDSDINNPFLESDIKYIQIVEDSIDKKILGKLKYQNEYLTPKQMESLTNNLIEINNNNTFSYYNNNFNLGNLSSIHKINGKYISREDSPTSQRDDELDLTSFSTTIGGKISHTSKMNNSKQVKTFKIKGKDGLVSGDIDNTNNKNLIRNRTNKSNNSSRNNSNNNSYRNTLSKKDSLLINFPENNNSNNIVISSINYINFIFTLFFIKIN